MAVAVGGALLLNIALLGSLVWSEWLPPGIRGGLWLAAAVVWGGSAITGRRCGRPTAPADEPGAGPGFSQAIEYYLQGNWFEAERLLVAQLHRDPRDVDARLMIATLLRHTGRLDEAERQLHQLGRIEASHKWNLEIGRERQLLAEARVASTAEGPSGQPDPAQETPPLEAELDRAA